MILSFQKQFVARVVDGTKPHSIRAGQRWRELMSIQFYEGSYRRKRTKFRPDGVALVVQQLEIKGYPGGGGPRIFIDGRPLMDIEANWLARADGFDDYAQLLGWFRRTHGLPFTGQLIIWQPGRRY